MWRHLLLLKLAYSISQITEKSCEITKGKKNNKSTLTSTNFATKPNVHIATVVVKPILHTNFSPKRIAPMQRAF